MRLIKFNYKEKTCFILGSGRICFFIMEDKTINVAKISLLEILDFPELEGNYIQINVSKLQMLTTYLLMIILAILYIVTEGQIILLSILY